MEEMRWVSKVPAGHMWLTLTFSVVLHDGDEDDVEVKPDQNWSSLDGAGVGLSEEMETFLAGCVGEARINKKEFSIGFSNHQDFVRFNLIGLESRSMKI